MDDTLKPSESQISYVRDIQRRLSLSNYMLDSHCQQRWGRPFKKLDRKSVSDLIDEMVQWQAVSEEAG